MALKKIKNNGYKPDFNEFRYHHRFRKNLAEAAAKRGETISEFVGVTRKQRSAHIVGCLNGFLRVGK